MGPDSLAIFIFDFVPRVPEEAAPIVRPLLTADKNQHFVRSRMSEAEHSATPEHDFYPFIIADADTGHGGDSHVRTLVGCRSVM
jgi:isocitrate lyase